MRKTLIIYTTLLVVVLAIAAVATLINSVQHASQMAQQQSLQDRVTLIRDQQKQRLEDYFASAIFNGEEKIGVLIFQLSQHQINNIVVSNDPRMTITLSSGAESKPTIPLAITSKASSLTDRERNPVIINLAFDSWWAMGISPHHSIIPNQRRHIQT